MSSKQRIAVGLCAGALALLAAAVLLPRPGYAQAGRGAGGGGGNRLIDNERVAVQRLTTAAGMREEPHTHANDDYVTIQITPGDFEVTVGSETTKGAVGKAWWLPRNVPHAVANTGRDPVDVIVVTVK